jgi:hypothetical protein
VPVYLLAATLALAGPQELLAQARTAEREGWPAQEQSICLHLLDAHPQAPQAEVCAARLKTLDLLSEEGSLEGYQSLEQARRGALPPQAVEGLLESENAALVSQTQAWLEGGAHQSAVYAALDVQRRRLGAVSWGALALLTVLTWPLGKTTWGKRPQLLGLGVWTALCVPGVGLVQLYGQLSPRLWALLPAGALVFLLAAGPAAQLRGLKRVLWGLLSGLGAMGSTFLVLRWAELLHWVGL